jgi:hypothetical protein
MDLFDKQHYVFNYVNNLYHIIYQRVTPIRDIPSDESDSDGNYSD